MSAAAIRLFTVLWPVCLLACSSARGSSPQGSGQTGSIGSDNDECRVAADCERAAEEELAQFTTPGVSFRHFGASQCTLLGVSGGPTGASCACQDVDDTGALYIGPAGLDCYVLGRAGDCLWEGSEFEGCDVTDAASCDATCGELEERLEADAARTFEAASLYSSCDDGACRSVIELDGRCFADRSYLDGRAYDCALGAEAILSAEQAAQQPPVQDESPDTGSVYVAGTNGFVSLTVYGSYDGTEASPTSFGAFAQFVETGARSVNYGESIDPLEGVDDCGVFKGSGAGAGGPSSFLDAADVQLVDAGTVRPLALSEASHDDFYSYVLELADVPPRYGERYGVRVSGGSFGSPFESPDGLRLPTALHVHELEANDHVEQQDLALTWTGQGDEPLSLYLIVNKTLDGVFEPTELRCLMKDDGAFTIPGAVLAAMPTGFASATFERTSRRVVESGSRSLLLQGSVQQQHRFVLGPVCDGSPSLSACQASVTSVSAAYAECGLEAPAPEHQCPSFLATSCDACPEYFECAAEQTRCTPEGFYTALACGCSP